MIGTSNSSAHSQELVDLVNTLQGTNSRFELTHGNTYPAVAMPWGMHTWTPQTGRNGDGWKYQYHKSTIRGFQQAHQCSSWTNDYCVFSLMPVVGELVVDEDQRASGFKHEDEIAKPDFYRVSLENGTTVEMAPSERGAFLHITYPEDQACFLILDGYVGECSLEILPHKQCIAGRVRNGRNLPEQLNNHFILESDQPFLTYGTWTKQGDEYELSPDTSRVSDSQAGAYVEFAPGTGVNIKVASSYISQEQAKLNLQRELGKHSDLSSVRKAAAAAWNQVLGKILVEGGTEEQLKTFYSCLYRASLFPRKFYEHAPSGEPYYRSPYDGKVYDGYMYTDTGLWDTFRAQMPLNALLRPQMHGRYVKAMVAAYDQCGWLPSWSFPGEAGSMIGNHAISVFADAWAKGIRTFDAEKALAAYKHETSSKGPWGPSNGREGWREYNELGFLPYPRYREATAKTLEYAYDDFCGYQLARSTDHDEYAITFASRMFNYRNVYDADSGFMRGRNAEGRWSSDFDPIEWGGPFTEGCAWHWVWSVFHDVAGLVELMGGEEAFSTKLDAVFQAPSEFKVGTYGAPIHEMREMAQAEMGQYAHGNQPIQHMVYLYNYCGKPWNCQRWVRTIMDRLYNSSENGYPGDEDQGQTSSWYVLSAMGFYSVCPGTDEYVVGSPLFQKATITLENGNQFVISAANNSAENVYIQAAALNGKPLPRNLLRHQEIAAGGELLLEMGPHPNLQRGTRVQDRPLSVSTTCLDLR